MTKAMTTGKKRRAKKAHAEFMASITPQPGQEAPAAQPCAIPAQPRMKPTREARAQARYEEVTADTKGAKHFRRKFNCLLDMLEGRKTISKQRAEAGRRFAVQYRVIWGSGGARDSCIPPVGGVSYESDAQVEIITKFKALHNRILNMCGPGAYSILVSVSVYETPLGMADRNKDRYNKLKSALDAAAFVLGIPSYDEEKGA